MANSFKVIVVTKEGTIKISDQYDRKSFVSNMIYDFNENTLRRQSPIALAYLLQFVTTCIPTLLIEGILLIEFSFFGKKNGIFYDDFSVFDFGESHLSVIFVGKNTWL